MAFSFEIPSVPPHCGYAIHDPLGDKRVPTPDGYVFPMYAPPDTFPAEDDDRLECGVLAMAGDEKAVDLPMVLTPQ